jgi:nitroimidazol reductase NimA-like FMN-containing flavoprotein (pyridoxamine 5'-phosphate oxidase superfamily)
MRPNEQARAVLNTIKYATIATTNDKGWPWSTPVAIFHFDNDYTLYWASWKKSQHSINIRDNQNVFIAVYDSTPENGQPSQGVYIKARAVELTDKEEVMKAALVFKDDPYNPPDGERYMGEHARRIYKAVPEKIWMNDDDSVAGDFVDIRVDAEEPKDE